MKINAKVRQDEEASSDQGNANVDTIPRRIAKGRIGQAQSEQGIGADNQEAKLRLKRLPAAKVGSSRRWHYAAYRGPLHQFVQRSRPRPCHSFGPRGGNAVPSRCGDTIGEPIDWGFKASFSGYVSGFGSIQVFDGATKIPFPGFRIRPPPMAVRFVFPQGEVRRRTVPGEADDQAVLNGTGSASCTATSLTASGSRSATRQWSSTATRRADRHVIRTSRGLRPTQGWTWPNSISRGRDHDSEPGTWSGSSQTTRETKMPSRRFPRLPRSRSPRWIGSAPVV